MDLRSKLTAPELPDIQVCVKPLRKRITGRILVRIQMVSPFLLRSVDPPINDALGKTLREIRHSGKRIVIALTDDYRRIARRRVCREMIGPGWQTIRPHVSQTALFPTTGPGESWQCIGNRLPTE